jgi:hypothetical protein
MLPNININTHEHFVNHFSDRQSTPCHRAKEPDLKPTLSCAKLADPVLIHRAGEKEVGTHESSIYRCSVGGRRYDFVASG